MSQLRCVGVLGEGEQTEMWSVLLSRPVEAATAEARGAGGMAQLWVAAPEPLPSCCQWKGELPPDFSRLE